METKQEDDVSERQEQPKTVKVAMLPFSWGKAENPSRELKAIQNALIHWNGKGVKEDGTVSLRIYEVTEDFEITERGGIRASEFKYEEELEVDAELLEKASRIQADLEYLIEVILQGEDPKWDWMKELVK